VGVAVDFTRAVAVLDVPGSGMRVVPFDRASLTARR
jgi:hypothetical protein